jgi:uncharacterized protein (TIGR03435 family)
MFSLRWFTAGVLVTTGLAQTTAPLPRFEVASIKPSAPGQPRESVQFSADRFTARYVSTRRLISLGFHVYEHQITGGPSWIESALFDIEAKAPGQIDLKQSEQMIQSLLADRFQLTFHREMREQSLFELVVGKNGPKLNPPATDNARNYGRPGAVVGHNAPVEFIASMLTFMLGKTVVNKTGIEGKFSYNLEWSPDGAGARDGVSLFTAIQEQLGLKLEASKGQVDVLVIDGVEKPSDN